MFLFKTWLQTIGRFIRWSTETLPSSRDMVQWQGTRIGRSNLKLKDFQFDFRALLSSFQTRFLFFYWYNICVLTADKLSKCLITCHETCSKVASLRHDILIRDILSFMCGVLSKKCKRFFYSWLILSNHAQDQTPEIALSEVSLHGQSFNSKNVNCFRLVISGKKKKFLKCIRYSSVKLIRDESKLQQDRCVVN